MTKESNAGLSKLRVLDVRRLTEDTAVLRFERAFDFEPGQYVRVGLPGQEPLREYSLYSSVQDKDCEILLKEVQDGVLSPPLCDCLPGDLLVVEGPLGWFTLQPGDRASKRFVFVATGTGISPFHSMVQSYPDLDYRLLHGVAYARELYEAAHFDPERLVSCVTREKRGRFPGRVTACLQTVEIEPDQLFYFCGNSEMIFEAFSLLRDRGVDEDRMHAEIYF